jgi:hypothetical protein
MPIPDWAARDAWPRAGAVALRHPYIWTSLGETGVNDDEDAYRISLAVSFSPPFRVGRQWRSPGGWQSLPERELSWAVSDQVQEAQAVLTRRGPRR